MGLFILHLHDDEVNRTSRIMFSFIFPCFNFPFSLFHNFLSLHWHQFFFKKINLKNFQIITTFQNSAYAIEKDLYL